MNSFVQDPTLSSAQQEDGPEVRQPFGPNLELGIAQRQANEQHNDVLRVTMSLYGLTEAELRNLPIRELYSRKQAAFGNFIFYMNEYQKRVDSFILRLEQKVDILQEELRRNRIRLAATRLQLRYTNAVEPSNEDENLTSDTDSSND